MCAHIRWDRMRSFLTGNKQDIRRGARWRAPRACVCCQCRCRLLLLVAVAAVVQVEDGPASRFPFFFPRSTIAGPGVVDAWMAPSTDKCSM